MWCVPKLDDAYIRCMNDLLDLYARPYNEKEPTVCVDEKSKQDYATYLLELITKHYSEAEKVHLVADNLNTHSPKCLKEILGDNCPIFKKLIFHFTPVHASWLNQAELEIGVMERQCLKGRIPDEETLRMKVQTWEDNRNAQKIGINWKFTIKQAEVKFKLKSNPN